MRTVGELIEALEHYPDDMLILGVEVLR